MHPGSSHRRGVQQARNPRIGCIGVLADQRGGWAILRVHGPEYDRARTGLRQLLPVARIGQKRQGAHIGARERRNALDARVGITAQLAAKAHGEFPK